MVVYATVDLNKWGKGSITHDDRKILDFSLNNNVITIIGDQKNIDTWVERNKCTVITEKAATTLIDSYTKAGLKAEKILLNNEITAINTKLSVLDSKEK